jgi:predicted amidohydrolase
MPRPLRVGLVQMRSGLEPQANRAQALPYLREAAAKGARLVATPECTPRLDRDRGRMLAAIRPEEEDADIRAWAALAAELGVWLLLGSTTVQAPDGRGCNRSLLFAPNGKIAARYDKIHLFDVQLGGAGETYRESATFAPGAKAVVAQGPADAKIGLTICYDMRFPALYQALANSGAELILVPSAFTRPTGAAHWETLLRARAIENLCYVVGVNRVGRDGNGATYAGDSVAVDFQGQALSSVGGGDRVETAVLDLESLRAYRRDFPAHLDADRFEIVS